MRSSIKEHLSREPLCMRTYANRTMAKKGAANLFRGPLGQSLFLRFLIKETNLTHSEVREKYRMSYTVNMRAKR